MLHVRMSRV